jgi:hypothetical protein
MNDDNELSFLKWAMEKGFIPDFLELNGVLNYI